MIAGRNWIIGTPSIGGLTKYLKCLTGILLAACTLNAEPHNYTGTIVNGKCAHAAETISRNTRGYIPGAGTNTFANVHYKALNTKNTLQLILRHCSVNPGVTEFALLDEQGNYFLLDEPGNVQVMVQAIPVDRETLVTIRGNVDHGTLNVLSLTKRVP